MDAFWPSVGAGVGLGILHHLASRATYELARRHTDRFEVIVLGGVLVRLLVSVTLAALVLVFVPVAQGPFALSFLATFVLETVVEARRLTRRA